MTRGPGFVALCLVLLVPTPGRADDSLSGPWNAAPARVRIEVESWGPDCGPRPPSQSTEPGGTVEVSERGVHLAFAGAFTARTDACWSRNPKTRKLSSNASGNTWRTTCGTRSDNPQAERGVYSVRLEGGRLVMREESTWNWQLKGSRCIARRSLSRTLTRPGARAAADEKPPIEPPEVPKKEPTCTPGKAARLRIRPGSMELAPAESGCFRARVVDAKGCVLGSAPVEWKLIHSDVLRATLDSGCFQSAQSAAEAEGNYRVVARLDDLRDEASVVVRVPDLSDLIARRETTTRTVPADTGKVETEQDARVAARTRRTTTAPWLFAMVGLAFVTLLLGFVLLSRRRRPTRAPGSATSDAAHVAPPAAPVASSQTAARAPRSCPVCGKEFAGEMLFCPVDGAELAEAPRPKPPSGQPMVCPTCRRGYPPDARFCPQDSDELVPYALFMAEQRPDPRSRAESRICPSCGGKYDANQRFCGKDGTELVLVN